MDNQQTSPHGQDTPRGLSSKHLGKRNSYNHTIDLNMAAFLAKTQSCALKHKPFHSYNIKHHFRSNSLKKKSSPSSSNEQSTPIIYYILKHSSSWMKLTVTNLNKHFKRTPISHYHINSSSQHMANRRHHACKYFNEINNQLICIYMLTGLLV